MHVLEARALDTLWRLLPVAVGLVAAVYLGRQVRRPSKWTGRPFAWLMNHSHSTLTDWGLQHVKIDKNFTLLDVGCGGGRTIQKLAAVATEGKVYGVDYAEGSVAASRSKNAQAIHAGRVKIKQASVSQLPFADNKFDLATAIETQYYWPDLPNDMQEVLRVLKPGGTLLIIAESYKGGSNHKLYAPVMKLLGSSSLGVEDQRELLSNAGYADIQVMEEHTKGWICVTGKKPSSVC
ncbi:MAG TPA: class I SAM-dependent methyltransferase [Candidatus Methylomirabilis sp.]|nr:class I SAM-dependent methyltransferase [Candidatus Methylomirabilis sp.]